MPRCVFDVALFVVGCAAKEMYPMKRYVEARLGKHIESAEKLRKFLHNDRKVRSPWFEFSMVP